MRRVLRQLSAFVAALVERLELLKSVPSEVLIGVRMVVAGLLCCVIQS